MTVFEGDWLQLECEFTSQKLWTQVVRIIDSETVSVRMPEVGLIPIDVEFDEIWGQRTNNEMQSLIINN